MTLIMEENLRKTCLYDSHIELGAKMSPFAGFMMPIQYSGITEEHLAVRHKAGIFDVSHMGEIFVSGPDAERFVNHIFTNNVKGMEPGHILYGMMLYPDGGTVDDLLVYKEKETDSFLLVVNAANIQKDYDWMVKNADGYNVSIHNDSESWGQIAVQGPEAEKFVCKVTGIDVSGMPFYTFNDYVIDDKRVIISRTGYTGEDGFEIYSAPEITAKQWKAFLEAGVTPCGLGCRDTLRFEAGLPLYGDELSADITPVMSGLSMFCKLDKDEFIGKEAIEVQKAEGPAKKVVGLEIMDKAIARSGYPVELEDGTVVGEITTGYRSISLDKSLCFALVLKQHSALGTSLYVRIRKKVFPAVVVKKRFYQTNYKK